MPAPLTEASARSLTRHGRVLPLRILAYLLIVCLFALLGGPAAAQNRSESELKAAFLYHFGSYIEWPATVFEDAEAPLVIGLIGADNVLGPLVDVAQGRTVLDRTIAVRRLEPDDDPGGVHILFIGESVRPGAADAILARAHGLPVLTVTESVYVRDSAIRFVIDHDRVRFDASLAVVHDAGLRISSRLLAIARRVEGGP